MSELDVNYQDAVVSFFKKIEHYRTFKDMGEEWYDFLDIIEDDMNICCEDSVHEVRDDNGE